MCIPELVGKQYIPKCECDVGYGGKNCQLKERCDPNPCMHGGNCVQNGDNSFTCKCPNNFTGKNYKNAELLYKSYSSELTRHSRGCVGVHFWSTFFILYFAMKGVGAKSLAALRKTCSMKNLLSQKFKF
jgi:hypothetical protein